MSTAPTKITNIAVNIPGSLLKCMRGGGIVVKVPSRSRYANTVGAITLTNTLPRTLNNVPVLVDKNPPASLMAMNMMSGNSNALINHLIGIDANGT